MASLHPFMIRMNYVDRSTPFSSRMRRRRYSSTLSSNSNQFADQNNNELLLPIVNPSGKRRKLSACIYKPIPIPDEGSKDAVERSPLLALHLFEGCSVTLRNEQTVSVSTERFLAIGRLYCQDNAVTSMAYYVPRMVPVSMVSSSYACLDPELKTETIIHCTKIEFRRRYLPVATQTVENDQRREDHEQQPCFTSYACWNVSEY
ncbi:uncharacterized protein LOC128715385 [Anopheles marshallii]|uniref:uncharacterized protein LOC128715385 n=1 Tax=Anopheles marshallii TaxID=1521116 RepID=UPI00237C25F6|nr:uncharacterized protein LOC128715385 [Anopheles marshallii]